MTPEELFQKFLDKSQQNKAIRTIGVGTASEITETNCVVLRDGQPQLHDVRFHATEDKPGSRHIMIPAEGSSVIYAIIDNQDTEAVLLMCSEIDKVLVEIGTTKYEIDKDGHLLQVGNEKLSTAIVDFIDEVKKVIVINGRSPNVIALEAIKTRFKKILK